MTTCDRHPGHRRRLGGLFAALRAAEHGSVIVLEAGPDAGNPLPDWALYDYALPEAYYHRYTDLDTGQVMPQGRGLGGGSTVNSAAALRGQPWCYDSWGVPGWGWDDVLPALNAIESDQQYAGRPYHGDAGLIPVTRLAPGPLDEAVFGWCRTPPGTRRSRTTTRPGALGHAMWTTNRRDGGRWGTWAGVVPAARAAGVDIRPDTTAVRLVFDGTRCTGAEVAAPGAGRATEVIRAGRVIVCAGAYGSPELLLRSGIGPEPCSPRSASRRCRCWPASAPTSRTTPGACSTSTSRDAGPDRGAAGQRRAAALRTGRPGCRARRGGDLPLAAAPVRPARRRRPPSRSPRR